jgi:hypothetical protein
MWKAKVQPSKDGEQDDSRCRQPPPKGILLASPVDSALFLVGMRPGYAALLTSEGWDGCAEFNLNAVKISFLHIQEGSSYFAKCLIMLKAWWNKSKFVEMAGTVRYMADAARTCSGVGQLLHAEYHSFFDQCDSNAQDLGAGVVASVVTCDLLRMLILMFAIAYNDAKVAERRKFKPGTIEFLKLLRCPPPSAFTQFDAWSGVHAGGRCSEMRSQVQEHVANTNSADLTDWIHSGWLCRNGPLFFVLDKEAKEDFIQDLDNSPWVASYYRSYLANLSSLLQEQISMVNMFQAKLLGLLATAFITLWQWFYSHAKDEYF